MVRNTADQVCAVLCHDEFKQGICFDEMIESVCKIQFNKSKHFVVRERKGEFRIKQKKVSSVTINVAIVNSRDSQ